MLPISNNKSENSHRVILGAFNFSDKLESERRIFEPDMSIDSKFKLTMILLSNAKTSKVEFESSISPICLIGSIFVWDKKDEYLGFVTGEKRYKKN